MLSFLKNDNEIRKITIEQLGQQATQGLHHLTWDQSLLSVSQRQSQELGYTFWK